MGKYILFVLAAPKDGQDAEFNLWYDERHLPDICGIPGIVSAVRYEAQTLGNVSPPQPYATIYELQTDDPEGVMAEMRRRIAAGLIEISDAFDKTSASLWLLKARE